MGVGIRRIAKKKIVGAVLALLPGLGLVGSVRAQGPQAPLMASQSRGISEARVQIKSRVFHFPIRIDKASQPRIKEVCLYMRDGQMGDWIRLDSVPPTAKSIRCQVPHDGEFCFQVQTIDQHGNAYPANLNQQAPAMVVFVETTEYQNGPMIYQGSSSTVTPVQPAQYATQIDVAPSVPPPPNEANIIPVIPPPTPGNGASLIPASMPAGAATRIVNQSPAPQIGQTIAPFTPVTPGSTSRQFFNTTRIGIDYNVARMPPSGLGKVEVWATQDQGRTWQKVGDNMRQRSPAEADLPGEGTYGIRLVATNGNGFGGKAPTAGDAPAITVEIDLTGPVVHALDVDPIAKNGALDLRWRVTDKNLASDCINLYYASQRSGPWTPIAFKVKNDEVYHWTLPRDVPTQLFFRLEATDQAGNVGRSETKTPTMLDMTEPDLNVIGISAMPQRVTPPGGN